jgi:hypothetical protein
MSDPFIKNNLSNYTEEEFVSFLEEIFREDETPTGGCKPETPEILSA